MLSTAHRSDLGVRPEVLWQGLDLALLCLSQPQMEAMKLQLLQKELFLCLSWAFACNFVRFS